MHVISACFIAVKLDINESWFAIKLDTNESLVSLGFFYVLIFETPPGARERPIWRNATTSCFVLAPYFILLSLAAPVHEATSFNRG